MNAKLGYMGKMSYLHTTGIRSFLREPPVRLLILGFLLVTAFCLRLYGLDRPPMDFAPQRQYHGALLARGFYEWWLTGDLKTVPPDGIIEPPILELIASLAYLVFGEEHLWVPRLLSALFWIVGGVFLYLSAKRLLSPNAAVFSVFFYLFVPYGVLAGRAFMPDPLMVMVSVISIFTILRYHEQPSTRRLLFAAVVSSLAVFVKPGICLFQIVGAFVSLAVYRQGVRRSLTSPHLLVFIVLSVLPSGLYGLFLHQQSQVSDKVVPQLLLKSSFWEGWLTSAGVVAGFVALLGGLVGVLLLGKGLPRALMIGLWGGYFLFGLTFTEHISTHPYYSLQLIPVVALSLGPVADLAMKYLSETLKPNYGGRSGVHSYGRVIVLALSILALILSAIGNRQATGWLPVQPDRATADVATFREIGEVVDHSRRTIVLFGLYTNQGYYPEPEYTYALMYHGQFLGDNWPYPSQKGERREETRENRAEKLFFRRYSKYSPEYFIISKGWWMRQGTEDLKTFLTENYRVSAQGDNYVVFDLKNKD